MAFRPQAASGRCHRAVPGVAETCRSPHPVLSRPARPTPGTPDFSCPFMLSLGSDVSQLGPLRGSRRRSSRPAGSSGGWLGWWDGGWGSGAGRVAQQRLPGRAPPPWAECPRRWSKAVGKEELFHLALQLGRWTFPMSGPATAGLAFHEPDNSGVRVMWICFLNRNGSHREPPWVFTRYRAVLT